MNEIINWFVHAADNMPEYLYVVFPTFFILVFIGSFISIINNIDFDDFMPPVILIGIASAIWPITFCIVGLIASVVIPGFAAAGLGYVIFNFTKFAMRITGCKGTK